MKVSQVDRSPRAARNVSPETTTRRLEPTIVTSRTRPPQSPWPSRALTTSFLRSPIAGQARSTTPSWIRVDQAWTGLPAQSSYGSSRAGRYDTDPAEVQPPLLDPNWVKAGCPPASSTWPRVSSTAALDAGYSASYPP